MLGQVSAAVQVFQLAVEAFQAGQLPHQLQYHHHTLHHQQHQHHWQHQEEA
jgi:hypothetical protein